MTTDIAKDPRDDLAARSVQPVVRRPQAGLSGLGIMLICVTLGIALFLILDANRRDKLGTGDAVRSQAMLASPAPLSLPPQPIAAQPVEIAVTIPAIEPQVVRREPEQRAPTPPPASAYMPPAIPEPQPPIPAPQTGRAGNGGGESALIIDLGSGAGAGNASAAEGTASDDQAVRASLIRNRSSLVPQGAMIQAVLETPIDSRRPGLVRAVVSRDVRGFDGTRVLIPRGSRLIGDASGDAKAGQKRVLVTWTRLIRPDGVAIRIGSPAADVLGGAGIRGKVNTHFVERFANAVLQSALTIGVNVASRPRSGSVIVGLPGQASAVGQDLIPNVEQGPTIKVASGAQISVFVARDLDFGGTRWP